MKEKYKGLSSDQIKTSIEMYGTNKLTEIEVETFWDKLKSNLADPIIRILIVALVINVIFFLLGKSEWYESLGIAIAIVLATLISTYSEYSNEESFQKLQKEASKIICKVFRDSEIKEIMIDDILTGDVVLIQPGDKIPADGKLLEGELKLDQASLTGETKEITKIPTPTGYKEEKKNTDLANKYNVYRGTVVVSGEAVMKVEDVGDRSLYGKLSKEMQTDDRESPLKVKLTQLAKKISNFAYAGSVLISLSYMFSKIVIANQFDKSLIINYCSTLLNPLNDLINAIILSIVVIVMAVPEGLPMMIAIVLSMNMKKLLNDNVLVRKLVGIETAGSLNILFSDKTGTITKGHLEAINFINGNNKEYSKFDDIPENLADFLSVSLKKNTNAMIKVEDDETINVIGGNATEKALLKFTASNSAKEFNTETITTIPFSSEYKYSATQIKGDHNLSLIKGAPERIINLCSHCYDENGNKVTFSDKSILENRILELADRSIRVIAVATMEKELIFGEAFTDLTLVGIIGIRDDLRQESVSAIKEVMQAGIQVVMITGDRKETAVAIAKEAGLITKETDVVLTSQDLEEMSDDEVKKVIPNIRVIARALPTDKSRLVRLCQELDLVVGMTGDGVNDSPALKKADVGFAMGSGTEVAKEASDIVILDDNFLSIAKAVLYGRTIFHNIRKFITFQLTINFGAVLIAFVGPFIGVEKPFSITQVLWINLVIDTLAALAFGGEAALHTYMSEKPKKRTESIITPYMWSAIITNGLFVAFMSIFFLKSPFVVRMFRDQPTDIYLLTGFFSFFMFMNVFNILNTRTNSLNLFNHITKNKTFIHVILLIVLVQVIMTYFGGEILRTAGLTLHEWIPVLGMAALIIPLDFIRKLIVKNR